MRRKYGNYYINDKYKFIIFTNQKSANTSIRKWILYFFKNKIANNIEELRHITNNMRKNILNLDNFPYHYKKIIIVRHPYSRSVSLFLDKFVKKEDKIYKKLSKDNLNFIEFLKLLKERKKNNFKSLDGHYFPQSLNKKNINFEHIVKVEDNFNKKMNNIIKKITKNKDYNYNFNEKAYNFGILNNKDNHIDPYMKISELEKLNNFNKKDLINEETKELIYEIYKDDFEFFKYSK